MDTTTTTTNGVDRLLEGICAGAVTADAYDPDATFDGVVPGWRMSLTGADAIVAEYARWFAHPGTLGELRRQGTADGEVVEYTVSWVEGGVPHAARHVHVLTLGDDGRIVDERVWCGGRWPATLLAEMEAAGR